jgi:hypothetical protein
MKSRRARKSCVLIAAALSLLIAACGPSAKQQATDDAIDALGKIDSALKVEVVYPDYSWLVADAQAKVDTASSLLPDGELKAELNAAMGAYKDAKWAWEISNQAPVPAFGDRDSFILAAEHQDLKALSFDRRNGNKAKELLKKYSVTSGKESNMDLILISTDDLLRAAWKAAHTHVERAKSLNSHNAGA